MTGLLTPKSSEIGHFVLRDFRRVPRPWDFSSGSSFCFSFDQCFGRGLKIPN